MFRTIRKKKNAISIDTAKALLQSSRRGVLAVNGDDGYPYAIPINYVYDDDAQKIYFHGARVGHKVDALRAVTKYASRYMEMKLSKKKIGHRLCRALWYSADATS